MCPYDEILVAIDLNSFLLFRSARLARTPSVSNARRHNAAIPGTETINATHQRSGTDERPSWREFITGIFSLRSGTMPDSGSVACGGLSVRLPRSQGGFEIGRA